MRIGAVETGGTNIRLAVMDENGHIHDRLTIPTKGSAETIASVTAWFMDKHIEAVGIGSFGPLDLNADSPTFGYITATPKKGWENTDILSPLANALRIPAALDTDVNAAVLGEVYYGSAKGCHNAVYMTVGTGIGVGVWLNDRLHHGMMHPEAGHIPVPRAPGELNSFRCCCPYHDNCLEGMASGPAVRKRWNVPAEQLYGKDEVWDLEAWYIACGVCTYIYTYSPERIIIGGGVSHVPGLIERVRTKVTDMLGGYIRMPAADNFDEYIVKPRLNDDSGIYGAGVLAMNALGMQGF